MIKLKDIITEEKKEVSKDAFEEFAETRMGGAEKISNNAHEKGGLALLTWHHFKVKLPYYKKASNGKLDLDEAKKEYDILLKKLYGTYKSNINSYKNSS
jgi:hypothetical protein